MFSPRVQVVCIKLTPLQQQLYEHFLSSQQLQTIMSGRSSGLLSSITALRKLVNHPKLIYDVVRQQQAAGAGGKWLRHECPPATSLTSAGMYLNPPTTPLYSIFCPHCRRPA